MHITMIKKQLADGTECRKCVEATDYLKNHGLWGRIDDVVWAREDASDSPGMIASARLGVDRAPFFVVRDDRGESVYTSVLQLVRERLGQRVTVEDQVSAIDVDEIGGI
jgi:hypothetical protein